MSSSAFLSLGVMEQVNGHGTLRRKESSFSSPRLSCTTNATRISHLTPLPVNGYFSSPPSVPSPLMLKTERKQATMIKIRASAKCLPGQIRFPNPNIVVNTGSSRALPSGLMNRSGLKESGSGYLTGSWRTALTKGCQLRANQAGKNTGVNCTMRSSVPLHLNRDQPTAKRICTLRIPTLRDKVTLIDVIARSSVGYTCGTSYVLHGRGKSTVVTHQEAPRASTFSLLCISHRQMATWDDPQTRAIALS